MGHRSPLPKGPSLQITKHSVVSIEYTLTSDDGEVLDTSKGREPLVYLHGAGNLIPGLEKELEGKAKGDAMKVRIAPEDAYGERNDAMVQVIKRDQLPPDIEVQVGMQLQAQSPQGVQIVTVVGVEGDDISLDGNHPLAGVPLNFEVAVVEIREATSEELEHGHVHGPGGHSH